MSMFKSRYVASLEQQIADLKQQLAAKDVQIEALINQRETKPHPHAPAGTKAVKPAEDTRPRLGNFIRSRDTLENSSRMGLPIEEVNNFAPPRRAKEEANA